jgi:hypothetical protein
VKVGLAGERLVEHRRNAIDDGPSLGEHDSCRCDGSGISGIASRP